MIADYPALIARVTERSGHSDVANRAAEYVGMAEEYIREALRIGSVDLIAALDGLADNGTNWLLEENPEAYTLAVLYQVHQAKGDTEQGALVRALLDDRLETISHDAKLEVLKGAEIEWLEPPV